MTSPILSNIYLKEFDGIFYGKIKTLGLENPIYTRYADDLVISFKTTAVQTQSEIEKIIQGTASEILARYGLQLNNHKSRSYNMHTANHVRITGVIITKDPTGRRRLSVGRNTKNKLYWDAIHYFGSNQQDAESVQKIKGMQSFVLSIEKCGYENCFSKNMMDKVHLLGFDTLKQLIDSL